MILIIDDDKRSLGPWTETLTDAGYKVRIETHPEGAIKALEEGHKFTGAIVDIMLPVGDLGHKRTDGGLTAGLALIDEIRSRDDKLPIVVLSIRRDMKDEVRKLNIPFVSKSLNEPEDLVLALKKLDVRPDREMGE